MVLKIFINTIAKPHVKRLTDEYKKLGEKTVESSKSVATLLQTYYG